MKSLLSELNNFSEATTIHGFAYLSKDQSKCTRLIWTLIVLGAAVVAGYFLYETIKGFDEHYTSTTIETRSVKEFPDIPIIALMIQIVNVDTLVSLVKVG